MYIFIAIVGLSILIIIHELGHLIVARAVGVGVERFSLFFGPAIVCKKIKGIDFRLGTIPLGGYVRLAGMHRPDTSDLRHLASQEPRDDNLILALDALDSAESLEECRDALSRIEPLARARKCTEKDLKRLSASLTDGAWWLTRPRSRLLVLIAGPSVNLAFAVVFMAVTFMIGGAGGRMTTTLDRVETASPAAVIGLKSGDHIIAINGQKTNVDGLVQEIGKNQPLTLIVQRGSKVLTFRNLQPRESANGPKIGVYFAAEHVYYDPFTATVKGTKLLGQATVATEEAVRQAFRSGGSKDIAGPIGIVRISADTMKSDPRSYIGVLALISLSLALLNILPIPPLDGGYVAITIVEAVRRRRLSSNAEIALLLIGFGLVLMMLMVGLQNDLHY